MAVHVDGQSAADELARGGIALSSVVGAGATRRRRTGGERDHCAGGKQRPPGHRSRRPAIDKPGVAQLVMPAGRVVDEPPPAAGKPHRPR